MGKSFLSAAKGAVTLNSVNREPKCRQAYIMIASVLDRHIDITPGICGGKPRIAGHRITVQNIAVWHERLGKSADEICTEYGLSLSDVYAALAYYFDHREEIEASIAEGEALVEQMKDSTQSILKQKLSGLRGE